MAGFSYDGLGLSLEEKLVSTNDRSSIFSILFRFFPGGGEKDIAPHFARTGCTCVALPTQTKGHTMQKYRSGATSTTAIFVYNIPQFCHNSGVTQLTIKRTTLRWGLRWCGKAAAVLVTCKHRDIVAEV